MERQTAIIMGAGPAGLTAAYELLKTTTIQPIIIEKSTYMGGISRTLNHHGNRIDLGGHRFFSKSDRVMDWWLNILPLQQNVDGEQQIAYHGATRTVPTGRLQSGGPEDDLVMLVRSRKSRIYFLGKFFDYPITLTKDTLLKLGLWRTLKIGLSYLKSAIFPIKTVANLEQFFINRFGRELYHTFFKEYTEKVWGIDCKEISAEWGEQRIKGLSITKTIVHYLKSVCKRDNDIAQKQTETSLIEKFLYPKLGPGQMWEEVARIVKAGGGQILTEMEVEGLDFEGDRVVGVTARDAASGAVRSFRGEYFFSTLPIKELVQCMHRDVPKRVREISEGLLYRDFITVGLLLKKLKIADKESAGKKIISDNWIYIQEPNVLAGRLQIFNNWSPYLVADRDNVWVGVEYFCYESDKVWKLSDQEMADLATEELHRIGIIDRGDVVDSTVHRMPKTYPAYFGTYSRFDELRSYVDPIENLFLIGRNGMHKYNNQDHSMLTAMTAVENIQQGQTDKANIWAVNTEMEYHETKEVQKTRPAGLAQTAGAS